MTLDSNSVVEAPLRPWTVLMKRYDSGSFVAGKLPPLTAGDFLYGDIQSIIQTSDATPGSLSFTLNDPATTINAINQIPIIGDEILVKASNVGTEDDQWGDPQMKVIFRGFITGISHQFDDNGSVYSIECADMKARLRDNVITASYNERYNAANALNFDDENSELLDGEYWSVSKIIRNIIYKANNQIFSFHSSLNPVVFFEWSVTPDLTPINLFDFSQVSKLENYVPDNIVFDNVPVLDAIYQVISSAGTYRMVYNPRTDKIVFTKVSIDAREAGDLRHLFFATADVNTPNEDYVYDDVVTSAIDDYTTGRVNVIKDNSVRRTSESTTVFRAIGAPIQWYSGHYQINNTIANMDLVRNPSGVYRYNNYNWDGYKYNFTQLYNGGNIKVGLPLYPQWDPAKGYKAYESRQDKVYLYNESTNTLSSATAYEGLSEKEGITVYDATYPINDVIIKRVNKDYNIAQGYIYEAWFPWDGKCLYCEGTGAVIDRSPWGDNPNAYFGKSRNQDGTSAAPALIPFDYGFATNSDGEVVPHNHPVPWKNTCPACRGVGVEPKFKIRNIYNPLVDVQPSEIKVEGAILTPSGNLLTWKDLVSEYSYSYGPQVQVEETLIGKENQAIGNQYRQTEMPLHPLAGELSIHDNGSATLEQRKIFPTSKTIEAIYKTQIITGEIPVKIDYERGNILFESKHSILCSKEFSLSKEFIEDGLSFKLRSVEKNEVPIYSKESLDLSYMSYWRPARAWIICYFARPRFYERIATYTLSDYDDTTGRGRNPAEIPAPSGIPGNYKVKFAIQNDRPVYEIYKMKPSSTEFNLRPIIRGLSIEDYKWQISPLDYGRLPVPSNDEYTWGGDLLTDYENRKYYFKTGCTQVIEPITPLEAAASGAGFTNDDIMKTDIFGKTIEWTQRDDRYKLISAAIRELDKVNDINISGNVVVRGENYDIANGLGYVTYQDGVSAVIVKMVHDFSGGAYTTTMELSTEEFRLGEKTEKEKDSSTLIKKSISKGLLEEKNRARFLNQSLSGKKRIQKNIERSKNNTGTGIST